MDSLIIAELENGLPNRASLATISAAKNISENIDLLVLDFEKKEKIAKTEGIRNVFFPERKCINVLAEEIVPVIEELSEKYDFIIAPSGTFAKNFLPRLAAKLDSQPISDIIKIHDKDTFDRPIYAGNAIATVKSEDKKKLLTIRATAFSPVSYSNGDANLIKLPNLKESTKCKFLSSQLSESERPELSSAKIVISAGRGIGSSDNFKIIEALADKLGAAVGASRAAVDAGYISNDYQVGQTGKVVAPDLYIAVGISGAIQHLAGMKDSKIIVAINKDEDAPIFQIADYGIVGDLFSTIPEITSLV